ncbi:hypothetical protein J2046_003063 [Rhizobium petrolearium]|uniref:hypothetical protein n=1 Tax=Neorhizobium petrolearium TaxID=515361 RepID=UPI001AE3488A|nr:hypothetical protein [Neorhizobium petrolearium]MBP1844796.1 hypothetical protein [Neorhizobium petrolearium]
MLSSGKIEEVVGESISLRFNIQDVDFQGEKLFIFTHKLPLAELQKEGKGAFPDSSFVMYPCFTGRDESGAFRKIITNKKRVGWLVPVNYFAEPDLYLDEPFLLDFAYAGMRQALINPSLLSFSEAEALIRGGVSEAPLESLFSPFLSFCVLSRQVLEEEGLQFNHCYYSLKRQGVFILSNRRELEVCSGFINDGSLLTPYDDLFMSAEPTSLKICAPSSTIAAHLNEFTRIVQPTALNLTSPWTYLSYYQVLEMLIEDVLSKEVRQIAQEQLTAWELRKRLAEISGEKKRLHIVNSVTTGRQRATFDRLHALCVQLLDTCGETTDGKDDWVASMYACRNLIVHNQLSVYRSGAEGQMPAINIFMMKAVLDIMFNYK